MSLKSSLNQIIKDRRGEIYTLKELEEYCHKARYKLSNAERRLREMRGEFQPVYNEKKTAIIGYKYETNSAKENPFEQIEKTPLPSNPETGSKSLRTLWNDSGTISGPYISHRTIPQNGVDDNQHNHSVLVQMSLGIRPQRTD